YYLINTKKDLYFILRAQVILIIVCCGLAFMQYMMLRSGASAALRTVLMDASETGSLAGVADAYNRKRLVDVNARTVGVDLLNRSLLTGAFPVPALRALGVAAARNIPPLRRTMMRVGLG
ncbi:MAG: hypothetical protein AAF615_08930, partial [Pseudomonadota bacterium]